MLQGSYVPNLVKIGP